MFFALLLWLFFALAAATLAAERCNHLQLGLVFVLLSALPPLLFTCRALKRKPRKRDTQKADIPCDGNAK